MSAAYALSVWDAAHRAALADLMGASGDPLIGIYDAGDVLLAQAVLDRASAAVDVDAQIVIPVLAQEDSALAAGGASYALLKSGEGVDKLRLDCVQGASPVAGSCVLNTLAIALGAPVNVSTITIPAGTVLA
jgi:hypothetical protein